MIEEYYEMLLTINSMRLSSLSLIAVLLFALTGCGSSSTPISNTNLNTIAPDQTIQLVAAESFYGELAKAVGGERVKVTSILEGPDVDPHGYEPTAETARKVNEAHVILYNGIGYDEWMKKLIKANSNTANQVIIAVGSDLLKKQDGDNPHVWYDPDTMPKLADLLAAKLAVLDPNQADAYKIRAEHYKASLAPIADLVKALKQSSYKDIAVSEPVFDYMAEALQLKAIVPKFALAVEEETDPSPGDVAKLQTAIKTKAIQFFVQNTQVHSPIVRNMSDLAKQNQIPIVQVSETAPHGQNYVQWMTDILNQVQAALMK
jgi:zinc/manganese transport system substrate-binding protein